MKRGSKQTLARDAARAAKRIGGKPAVSRYAAKGPAYHCDWTRDDARRALREEKA